MKGVIFNSTKKILEQISQEFPKLENDQILMKVLGFCINRADILETKGLYKGVQTQNILGIEFVGKKVDQNGLVIDDTVYGGLVSHGGYANYLTVNKNHIFPMNFNFSLEQKIAIPEAFLTAFQLINNYSDLQQNSIVYIPAGASGIGTALIQICQQLYNCKIITSCSSKKIDFLKTMNCDYIFDYQNFDKEKVLSEIKNQFGGVNCVFDCVLGNQANFHCDLLSQDGVWIIYGLLGGPKIQDPLIFSKILWKRLKIQGSLLRNRSDEYKKNLIQNFQQKIIPLFEQGKLNSVIGKQIEINFDENPEKTIQQGFEEMLSNQYIGRIVLKVKNQLYYIIILIIKN